MMQQRHYNRKSWDKQLNLGNNLVVNARTRNLGG